MEENMDEDDTKRDKIIKYIIDDLLPLRANPKEN